MEDWKTHPAMLT
jgi:hypothetical protein